ncbi:hypothetical protein FDC58_03775 [Clostridium botulinum]|nr:hypothetical protein [Clostridium botulinum]NFP28416.1 hypothetical protein [Clostridium botulinum]
MDFVLEFFANERYKLLKLLWNNQVKIKDDLYVALSQQEVADMAHISKLKTNRIIGELIDEQCIYLYNNKRGKYALTDKGLKVIQIMQNKNV